MTTTPPVARSVYEIPRNNVAACLAYYKARGAVTDTELRTMLRLQDDVSELEALSLDWTVVST